MKTRQAWLAGTAIAAVGMLALTGCSSGGGDPADDGGATTLTMWHNSTTGDGKQYWADAAAAFHEENPDVTIEVTSIQNEDMDGKLQTAVNSGDMPDIFMARGGGKLADIVAAGKVKDSAEQGEGGGNQARDSEARSKVAPTEVPLAPHSLPLATAVHGDLYQLERHISPTALHSLPLATEAQGDLVSPRSQ